MDRADPSLIPGRIYMILQTHQEWPQSAKPNDDYDDDDEDDDNNNIFKKMS